MGLQGWLVAFEGEQTLDLGVEDRSVDLRIAGDGVDGGHSAFEARPDGGPLEQYGDGRPFRLSPRRKPPAAAKPGKVGQAGFRQQAPGRPIDSGLRKVEIDLIRVWSPAASIYTAGHAEFG